MAGKEEKPGKPEGLTPAPQSEQLPKNSDLYTVGIRRPSMPPGSGEPQSGSPPNDEKG